MNPNSTPREGLSASVADSGGESKDRDSGAASAPQAGVQSLEPRAAVLDTITTALNRAGFWLAIEGRDAIADALRAVRDQETEQLRTRLDLAHQARRTTTGYLDEIRVHLIRHGIDPEHLRHDGDIPIRLQELLDTVDPKEQA
ncbi:hypothetical protein ACFUJR_14935 [Streptomyces sp. NPDC057271]|uniref:hypothetical protein n=1 Tax=unclassified Streptomyces TaxID=2593676 RepID=UPI00363AAA4E